MRIYVASSWRNAHQPKVVNLLRTLKHEVYDFRHPCPGDNGFSWAEIDPNWERWTPKQFREALRHPIAQRGFKNDFDGMRLAEAVVLVLPCGRSAHLEAGYFLGARKGMHIFIPEPVEPELMYELSGAHTISTSFDELIEAFQGAWK